MTKACGGRYGTFEVIETITADIPCEKQIEFSGKLPQRPFGSDSIVQVALWPIACGQTSVSGHE